MTTQTTASDLPEIATQALEAAQLATEAAHAAEAAIEARNEAAQSLGKVARYTQWLTIAMAASAALVLIMGGLFWMRASSHLSEAAEVQASATAGFVENLMQMNDALSQMQQVIEDATAFVDQNENSVAALIARLDQRLEDVVRDVAAGLEAAEPAAPGHSAVLLALAEVEQTLSRQIADLAAVSRTAQAQPPASANLQTPARPAPPPAATTQPRRATPPATQRPAPAPNPFRFP